MAAERIAENLAYINWTLLASLAVGSFWFTALGRLTTSATKGYLAFVTLLAAGLAALAALSDDAVRSVGSGAASQPGLQVGSGDPVVLIETARLAALWALAGLAVVYGVVLLRGGRAPWLAAAGSAVGFGALLAGAAAWGGDPAGSGLLLVQLVVLAAATGGVWASMILGHWYLVTPKLPEAPLVRFARLLTVVVGAQVALFAAWRLFGAGPGGEPGFSALGGDWALFVWLRLIVGLAMPLVISWAALQTARTRSMESATGLLYIDVGLVAAGTILAAGLYFGAGLLV
ncbi:MAG TPA: hypothetical protein VJ506_05095 [Candidatus Limnocylindrales bacterium]|nr:hypothetical protein [Candidatus Limnocylindrales bacterium]